MFFGAAGVVIVYLGTTLAVWFGHYLPHHPNGRLREFHLSGHHKLYPDSGHTRSETFLYGSGKNDSLVPLLPWIIGFAALEIFVLPSPWRWLALMETVLLVAVESYVHIQFHIEVTWLGGFGWFIWARAAHDIHHDRNVNFMVADPFWDKMFGTFEQPWATAEQDEMRECDMSELES
jgi:sterol desaturase/sphingolipid hydroxylase (fatty acid hydroxylase superfamily)